MMTMTKTYHTELGFPKDIVLPSGTFNLSYSYHAQNASYDDRYGQMNLPTTLNVDNAKLIEIEDLGDDTILKKLKGSKLSILNYNKIMNKENT